MAGFIGVEKHLGYHVATSPHDVLGLDIRLRVSGSREWYLGILKWLAISLCDWPDFCNSRIAEIVLDKYSRLEPLGFERTI